MLIQVSQPPHQSDDFSLEIEQQSRFSLQEPKNKNKKNATLCCFCFMVAYKEKNLVCRHRRGHYIKKTGN